jgi:hypothetical protein
MFAAPPSRSFPTLASALVCVLGPASIGCNDLIVPGPDSGSAAAAQGVSGGGAELDAGGCIDTDAAFGAPADLRCTGLYAAAKDGGTLDPSASDGGVIAASVEAYDPGLTLWNDGASEKRWVSLPVGAGKTIDTSDMNEWVFPPGTRFWQEISLSGHRVETRYLWKRGENDWVRATYEWATDTGPAIFLAAGKANAGGSSYEIPSLDQCDTCHGGRADRVLGFEAVSLSTSMAKGLTMSALVSRGILSAPPSGTLQIPDDGTGLAAPALGWLHANCGTSCHNGSPGATASETGLLLRLEVLSQRGTQTLGALTDTNTFQTAVNVPANLAPYGGLGWRRITPNDPFTVIDGEEGTSLLPLMAEKRNDATLQMPPIATHVPDEADVAALRAWIQNGSFP